MADFPIDRLYRVVSHPIFLSATFSWFIAQGIKALIEAFKARGRLDRNLLITLVWRTGGMPSSHSSTVTSLTTSIGITQGTESAVFLLSLFYAILTIRDALGVRKATGVQAKTMNKLGADLQEQLDIEYLPVKEVKGHKATEVIVGIILGFFIAVAFCSL
ncbi:divergent PAP2 family protein [Spirochaeta cellobiosiphila]|uniref:divergent PAP2 family protein n=1 Tax=Spirochaeta cellobiosiphila TaxID=504483 RepID=UPI00041B69B7|nr:divergent PAP2 family protein [Spirochaeta cellobiosiphila]